MRCGLSARCRIGATGECATDWGAGQAFSLASGRRRRGEQPGSCWLPPAAPDEGRRGAPAPDRRSDDHRPHDHRSHGPPVRSSTCVRSVWCSTCSLRNGQPSQRVRALLARDHSGRRTLNLSQVDAVTLNCLHRRAHTFDSAGETSLARPALSRSLRPLPGCSRCVSKKCIEAAHRNLLCWLLLSAGAGSCCRASAAQCA
jgi:hypothetical protein